MLYTTMRFTCKGLGKNKSSRFAGLFSHLLRREKSYIALLCASFRSSNMTENPAQYGTIYSCRGPNTSISQRRTAWLNFLKKIVKLAWNLLSKTCANLLDFLKNFISSQEFLELKFPVFLSNFHQFGGIDMN